MKRALERTDVHLALLTIAVAALHHPLFSNSLIDTHDLFFYQRRALDYLEALRHGPNVLPLWSENAVGGMGRPFFLYSAPLMNLVCATLTALVGSVLAVHMALFSVMTLSVFAAYFWLRERFSPRTALLAALSFATTDYVMRESLARGALAEAAALMFFGWCLWAAERAFARNNRAMLPLIALFFGGLVISHNLSMIFCGPALVGYIAIGRWRFGRWPSRGASLAMPFLGLAVSCFFWLPTFVYGEWLNTARYVSFVGALDYMNTAQLFSIGHTSLALDAKRRLAFYGFTLAGALGLGLLILNRVQNPEQRRFGWTMALGVAVTFFVMSDGGRLLFPHIKLLQFLQFPWRMFVLVSYFMSGLAALALAYFTTPGGPRRSVVVALLLVPPCISALDFAAKTKREDRPVPTTALEMRALGDVSFTFEDVSAHQCVPLGKSRRPITAATLFTSTDAVEFEGPVLAYGRRSVSYRSAAPAEIVIRTAYSPLWRVEAGGKPLDVECTKKGNMRVTVPDGEGELRAVVAATPLISATQWISLVVLMLLISWFVLTWQLLRKEIATKQEA
ncbi:MAG: glycosyltransferase family 39 protein [Myxococcota bacterium]